MNPSISARQAWDSMFHPPLRQQFIDAGMQGYHKFQLPVTLVAISGSGQIAVFRRDSSGEFPVCFPQNALDVPYPIQLFLSGCPGGRVHTRKVAVR
jgi:hypothetical protein